MKRIPYSTPSVKEFQVELTSTLLSLSSGPIANPTDYDDYDDYDEDFHGSGSIFGSY